MAAADVTDTLELENLDYSEFEASFDSITLALASHLATLAPATKPGAGSPSR